MSRMVQKRSESQHGDNVVTWPHWSSSCIPQGMLKLWKRTWEEEDPQMNSQESRLDGKSSSASSLDVSGAIHPSDTMSPSLPFEASTSKHYMNERESVHVPALKRLKTRHRQASSFEDEDGLAFDDHTLRQAKRENCKLAPVLLPTAVTYHR